MELLVRMNWFGLIGLLSLNDFLSDFQVALELRRDRVFQIWNKMVFRGLDNLLVLVPKVCFVRPLFLISLVSFFFSKQGGEAHSIVRQHVADGSLDEVSPVV